MIQSRPAHRRARPRLAPLEGRCLPATYFVTNTLDDPVSGAGDLPGSLRQAVIDANANPGADVIDATGVAGTVTLVAGQLVLRDAVTLTGPGAEALVVDANKTGRVFLIDPVNYSGGYDYVLSGVSVTGGHVTGANSGGGVYCKFSSVRLTLSGVNVFNNSVSGTGHGGGVASSGGPVVISGSTVTGNSTAAGIGGGVYSRRALTVTDTTISKNTAVAPSGSTYFLTGGGGVFAWSDAKLTNSVVEGNQSLNGGPGGGVYFAGNGTLTLCRIAGNSTSGPLSDSGDGGGVYARSLQLTADRCTFADNVSAKGDGGGLYSVSRLTLTNCSVHGNQALGTGTSTGRGGGVYSDPAGVLLQNCTVHGNTATGAGGGAYFSGFGYPGIPIQNCTITGNTAASGGGIHTATNSLTLESTIVSDNAGPPASPDIRAGNQPVTAISCNIGSTAGIPRLTRAGTFIPGSADLAPLADNGGPTLTRMPLPHSRVRGAGSNSTGLATDQRGSPRQLGAGVDIGAVESPSPVPSAVVSAAEVTIPGATAYTFTVLYDDADGIDTATVIGNSSALRVTGPDGFDAPTEFVAIDNPAPGTPRTATYRFPPPGGSFDPRDLGDYTISVQPNQVFDTTGLAVPEGLRGVFRVFIPWTFTVANTLDGPVSKAGDLPGSLRQAIFDANAVPTADLITFDPAVFAVPRTIRLSGGTLFVSGSTEINGPGPAWLTLEGSGKARTLHISRTALDPSTVVLSGVTISGGVGGSFSGGGVYAVSTALTLRDCVVTGNSAKSGGGVYASNTELLVENTTVSANSATAGFGGGIAFTSAKTLTVRASAVTGNAATTQGGGIYCNEGTTLIVEGSLVRSNSSASAQSSTSGGGGGIFFHGSETKGMTTVARSAVIRDSAITDNTSVGSGGGIYRGRDDLLTIERSAVSNNSAGRGGGGIICAIQGGLLVDGSTVSGNSAAGVPSPGLRGGGGVYFSGHPAAFGLTFRNTTISGNSTQSAGGAVHLANSTASLVVQNCTITDNTAVLGGGGIARSGTGFAKINLFSTIVAGNHHPTSPDVLTIASVTADRSLIGVTDGITTLTATATQTGTLAVPLSAKLGPLAANGGPTPTNALLPGSLAIDKGANPAALSIDQRGRNRVVGAAADIGAFEVQTTPPTVASVRVNDGAAQRSRVTALTVTFSETVVFPAGVAAAFALECTGPGGPTGPVGLTFGQVGNSVTLAFAPGGTVAPDAGGSLPDGNYRLAVVGTQSVSASGSLDGNNDGTGGDDFGIEFHRLFGDADGNRQVDALDLRGFFGAYGGNAFAFDFDGDGDVDAADFAQFRRRFGVEV